MGTPAKFLIIPDGAVADITALTQLTEAQITRLDDVLSDKETVRSGAKTYHRIAETLGVGRDAALKLLTAVTNIRRQRESFDLSDDDLLSDLLTVVGTVIDPPRQQALKALLRKTDEDHFVEKVTSLKHALLPHMVDARTVVDLRPVFSKDRETVEGLVLITYLDLTIHNLTTDEHETVAIQLSRKNIAKLKEKLADAEAKLKRLETSFPDAELFE